MRQLLVGLIVAVGIGWGAYSLAAKGGKGNGGGGEETHSCHHTKFAEQWEELQNADRIALGLAPMHHDCALGDLAEMICDNIKFGWNLTLDEMMVLCGVEERPLIVGLMGSCRNADCWYFVVNRYYAEDLRIILHEGATHCGEAQWSGNLLIACYSGDFTELLGE